MDDQDAAALKQLHDDFLQAFRSNDQQALGAFYTDTAVVLPPRGGMLTGRDEIVTFWRNAERIQDLRFEPKAVEKLGETTIREAGLLEIMVRGQDREIRVNPAKYMSVWSKTDDGWKLDSSIWNLSPGGPRQGGQMRQGGRAQGGGRGLGGQGGQGGGGRGQGGGRGPGGGQGRQGGGQGGGGYGQGGGGRGPGGGRGQGGGRPAGGGYGQGGGAPGGGFGPRSRQQRANQDAPMVPRID